ncbi:8464_t:CDS:2, partial [Cetraspora pellucida]
MDAQVVLEESSEDNLELTNFIASFDYESVTSFSYESINITRHILTDEGFTKLMAEVFPSYKLPSEKIIKSILLESYNYIKQTI